MPKTYNSLTVANAAAGSAILASDHAKAFENINNYRVPPVCVAKFTTSQVIPNITNTVLTFGSKEIDTDTIPSPMYGTNRIDIQTAGIYLISLFVLWEPNGTGLRYAVIRKNATGSASTFNAYINLGGPPNAGVGTPLAATVPMSLIAGDYIDVQVYQSSGGNLNINAYGNYLSATWVGQVS